MDVGAVIVHYNRLDTVGAVVDDLLAAGIPIGSIIVVDNSAPDTHDGLVDILPAGARVVDAPSNPGYASAVNVGVRQLRERGLSRALICTHELRLHPQALAELDHVMSATRAAIVGPTVMRSSDPSVIWSRGGRITRVRKMPRNAGKGSPGRTTELQPRFRKVDWIDGCCMLLSTDWWADAGGLNESYFLYIEETDYAVRLSKTGGATFVASRATVWQEPGRFPRYLAIRNRTLFLRRNFGSFALTLWLLENLIGVGWSARHLRGWWDRTTERGLALRHGFTEELNKAHC